MIVIHRNRNRAFTLVELLVVISIVALLVSILLPVLGGARRTTQGVACLSNMRQLMIATATYQADHKGYFPRPSLGKSATTGLTDTQRMELLWFNALDRYLQDTLPDGNNADDRNHASFKQDPVWLSFAEDIRNDNRTIKMNQGFAVNDEVEEQRVIQVRDIQVPEPVRTVVFVDGRAHDLSGKTFTSEKNFECTEGLVGLRHEGGANVAFADGHAARVVQEIRFTTAVPSWFGQPDIRQELVWDFLD